jgi:hypothetical protein
MEGLIYMPRYGAIEYAEPRGSDKAFVITKPCVVCGNKSEFLLNREGFERWQTDTKIQDALPELSADDRETLISGTCGPCFDQMFPPEPEE